MKETVQETVVDTLDYLMALVRDGVRHQAKSGLRPLQTRHSEVGMHLLWQEESYDHSIHYDALLNLPGNGTVSLSYCDDRAMPWPLRGVHRWSDADVVRVNSTVLAVDQAIACLDFIWDEARITDRLVNVCLIEEELEKNPVELSDEELQTGMDGFRRARKLYKAEDTFRWMERRGIAYPELERLVGGQVKIAKLRDRVVASRAREYFDSHAADFDTAYVARILLADEASALETSEKIRYGEMSFFEAAERHFVTATPSRQAGGSDLFRAVQRRDLPEDIGAAVFGSFPGSIVGPVRDEDRYAVIRVLSFVAATFDEPTQSVIKKILFEEWLQERRCAATIEWFWGNVSKTAQSARTDATVNVSCGG